MKSREIRVCGYMKSEALKHATFYLEPNVAVPKDTTGRTFSFVLLFDRSVTYLVIGWTYTPSSKQYQISNRKYQQDECTLLKDIPTGGSHILIVEASKEGRHRSYISHVVIF